MFPSQTVSYILNKFNYVGEKFRSEDDLCTFRESAQPDETWNDAKLSCMFPGTIEIPNREDHGHILDYIDKRTCRHSNFSPEDVVILEAFFAQCVNNEIYFHRDQIRKNCDCHTTMSYYTLRNTKQRKRISSQKAAKMIGNLRGIKTPHALKKWVRKVKCLCDIFPAYETDCDKTLIKFFMPLLFKYNSKVFKYMIDPAHFKRCRCPNLIINGRSLETLPTNWMKYV